jgi:hypothetical protein
LLFVHTLAQTAAPLHGEVNARKNRLYIQAQVINVFFDLSTDLAVPNKKLMR